MVTNQQKIVMQKEKRNSSKGTRQEDSRAEKWMAVGVDYSLGVKSNWGKVQICSGKSRWLSDLCSEIFNNLRAEETGE